MQLLQCGAQSYAWGKKARTSKVAKLLGESEKAENSEKRFAELWIGVHTSLPSKVVSSESKSATEPLLLKDFLASQKDVYLGQTHLDFYKSPTVPFLLKVLSIDMALSIQAHPTRALAKELHARDPKNYPDPNHKPELIVALTPFEALCCFRPIRDILHFVHQSKPLRTMLSGGSGDDNDSEGVIAALEAAAANEVVGEPTKDDAKAALKKALTAIYKVEKAPLEAAVAAQVAAITDSSTTTSDSSSKLDAVHEVFVRTNKLFPGDVGLWMMYFLNYLQLKPGEALFLGASEPHAYISGDGVEIMANSDNVVRAGLTPKFKDVDTLLSMLTYDTNALAQSKHSLDTSSPIQQYAPPAWCDDFSLYAVRLSRGGFTTATVDLPSVGLGVCTSGNGLVHTTTAQNNTNNNKKDNAVSHGTNFVLPIGKATFTLAEGTDECTVFIGTTNVHGATNTKSKDAGLTINSTNTAGSSPKSHGASYDAASADSSQHTPKL